MKHGKSPYTSTFYYWHGKAALFYSSHLTSLHSHNTMQLVLDTHKGFKFKTKDGYWINCKSLIIRENVIHQLDTNNSVQLIIYIDPQSAIAQTIKANWLHKQEFYSLNLNVFHFANSNELQQALLNPASQFMEILIDRILGRLSAEWNDQTVEDRILSIEQQISNTHPDMTSIKDLASQACLSESRLRFLFKKATGASLYRYMLWNKIRYATNLVMAGHTVNDAALDAGFTDGSHYHKMMIKIFGISPSNFLKVNRIDHIMICDKWPLQFETWVFDGQK